MSTTLCIELNYGDRLVNTVFRIEHGWTLRFILGRGVYGKKVKLLVHPGTKEFVFPEPKVLDDLDHFIEFVCEEYGSYRYEFFDGDSEKSAGDGYFHVIPEWHLSNGRNLTLSSLSCITHLAKLLGPLEQWKSRLQVAHEAGYNLLHLTPIQTLGISNSSYSIADYHKVNPAFGRDASFADVEKVLRYIETEWGMITVQDVVWNHAAKNSAWLQEHPECTYNCHNSPHLRPAYILDRALTHLSRDIADGKYEDRGVPATINANSHIDALRHILLSDFLPSLRLHEFFQINVDAVIGQVKAALAHSSHVGDVEKKIEIIQDPEFGRRNCTVDLESATRYVLAKLGHNRGVSEHEQSLLDELRHCLDGMNHAVQQNYAGVLETITNALIGHVLYERVADHGPKLGTVSVDYPLVTNYFLHPFSTSSVTEDEEHAFDPDKGRFLMACNGWVMDDDPLNNFAIYPSQVYLHRQLISWGDCIKLNYGNSPSDCPYLWDYMTEYTEQCARLFHGFRIDNCHSTPIHVAEFLLNKARSIRPDLYVLAELFTGSEDLDNVFVNRLGITSLIREAQNAPDSHEQGRFVYRYGGDPVGAFRSKDLRPAPSSVAHALFFDQTHDNPPPMQIRTAYDHVPTAAMTAAAFCASGSTRGYDEFVSFKVDVVKEERLYATWEQVQENGGGMVSARRLLNQLHYNLAISGFTEIFVDQINTDIVAITRHNPLTHESVLVISHCCFSTFNWTANCRPISVADDITEILFEIKTTEKAKTLSDNADFLQGEMRYSVEIYENVPFEQCQAVSVVNNEITFKTFPSGSVVAFKIKPKQATSDSCSRIEALVHSDDLRNRLRTELQGLSLQTFNFVLFRCEKEDQSEFGEGAYELPHVGKFVYCGLEGVRPVIKHIQETNDLGHPLCSNLRHGLWLCDYIVRRLRRVTTLHKVADLFEEGFSLLENVPHPLRPCYFELLFSYLRDTVAQEALRKLDYKECGLTSLSKHLAFNSIAFLADIPSARLPPVAKPRLGSNDQHPSSLSAGLPHFSEGIWRNWGRDTFIALPGLLLSTGRFDDARNIILSFAGALRHGLIPNLLGEGKCSRYNCRDAVWFWLAAILEFVERAPDGVSIFEDIVLRLYPQDDSEYGQFKEETLKETMMEALQAHFTGISFRERNAGSAIDEHMQDGGFNVNARINRDTGFVEGGNALNCGTWMDKMGSSSKAGNRGIPATPRDGAAVELQGLAVFVAEGLDKLYISGRFPYDGVRDGTAHWHWQAWANRLRTSFCEQFFVSDSTEHDFVNKRNIVKDSVGSTAGFTDFQLRPNFAIALALVPDLLPAEQAWAALQNAADHLLGPLGISTLDPSDWAYNGDYHNDDQSDNRATANGWNYHQGPEWLWVAGVFLKAFALAAQRLGQEERAAAVALAKTRLHAYKKHLLTTPWRSLPELTNANGAFCGGSCPAQAWSIGCLLDALKAVQSLL